MRSFSSGASRLGGDQNTVSRRPGSSPAGNCCGDQCGALLATRVKGRPDSGAPLRAMRPSSNTTSAGVQPNCGATMRASLSRTRSAARCTVPATAPAKRLE